jgi:hypothetical protein
MTCDRCGKPLRGPNHAFIDIPATHLSTEGLRNPRYWFMFQTDNQRHDVLCRSCCGDVLLALTQSLVAEAERLALDVA